MSISEGLDRCEDDFTNLNEDKVVDQTESYQLMENRPDDEAEGDSNRARKYTEKGLQYKRSVLMDRRSQLHKRLMRKSSIIDGLLYSKQSFTVVKENLGQFDNVFKLLTEVHQQHCKLLSVEEQHADNQGFEDVNEMVFSFKDCVYNLVRDNEKDKRPSSKSSAKSRSSGRSSGTRSTSSSKSSARERAIKEKLKMAELMVEASFIEKKHTSRYQTEKLELEEKVAKSKAKVKVFEELEQPTAALRTSFVSRKNAPCGKTIQADSCWNAPLLDAPHQRCTDRREHGRYLTRNFKMGDPDFTIIDQMNNPSIDLNTAKKDNWQEANEVQSYKLGDVSGRYSEENDYNTDNMQTFATTSCSLC